MSPPQCTTIRVVRVLVVTSCSGQVFSSALLLVSRSGLRRMSSTIGVNERHSLPDFHPRSVKCSRATRRSRATGTTSGTNCITSSAHEASAENHCRENAVIGALLGSPARAPHACRRLSSRSQTKQNDERLILIPRSSAGAGFNRNRLVDSRPLQGSHYLARAT